MSEFKGTKGSWKCNKPNNFSDTLVSFIESEKGHIAQTRGQRTGQEEECYANAKLMAAAPDLLTALEQLLSRDNSEVDIKLARLDAINAIKKATE